MQTAAIGEVKARFSKYISAVKKGEDVLVTERGKPVARIVHEPRKSESLRERLAPLAAQGLIILPTKGPRKRPFKPVKVTGKPASEMIIEDRR